jgi:hypothetical protein
MIVDKTIDISCGALEQVLLELGFERTSGTNNFGLPYVDYWHTESETLVALPERPKDELMYGGHYVMAVKHVVGRGVADRETFDSMLHDAMHAESA